MTEKQQAYKKNAGVVGGLPTSEDWGKSNGKLMDVKVSLSAEQIEYLQEAAWKEGISIEQYLRRLIGKEASE